MGDAITRTMGRREWGLLLALAVLWGGTFVFVEAAIRELPPLTIVALRVGLAAFALDLLLAVLGRRLPLRRRALAAFLGMGLLNNAIPFSLLVWGQLAVTGGLAAILNATTPLFTVLAASALTDDERAGPSRLLGVAVGLAGTVVVVGPEALLDAGDALLPQLACLAAALAYALAGIFGRRFRRLGIPPLETAAGQVTASSLVMIPLALALDRPWTLPGPATEAWAAVVGLALLSTALAYVIYFRILAVAGAVNLLLVTFLIPVAALGLGAGLLGEPVVTREILGMAVIGAGLALIDGRLPRLARKAAIG
jgi:drug/metabolite transporter (DMT)-like permease